MKTLTHAEVIKRLRELERRWPKDLWLFAGDASLSLLKKKNGQKAISPRDGEAFDQAYIIASFPKIESDGGGF